MSYAAIGVTLAVISTALSCIILKYKSADQPKPVKIVLFGLYFWGFIFFQLAICAAFYYFYQSESP